MRNFLHMEPKRKLERLPEETWGWRMKRAREDYAAWSLAKAVEEISPYVLTSTGTISRLEDLDHVPPDRRRRRLAYVAAVAYGLDPAQFGLGPQDAPEGLVIASGRCTELRLVAAEAA